MNLAWSTRTFEELTNRELHDLLRLRVDVFVVEQRCAYAEVDGRDPAAIHVLGLDGTDEIVAYARILPAKGDEPPHIGRVVVHRDHRNKGLASQAMHRALEILKDRTGSTHAVLSAQAHLEKYYERFGFLRIGPTYDWDGIPHVDMERQGETR